jgi:signal transduction histidine kinase
VADVLTVAAICAVSAGCGALLSLRPGVLATGALAAALAIAGAGVMPVLLTTLAPWTAGRVVRSRRQLIAALAERNRQLEAEQNALAELAVRRERARIARELHDIVAHHVAVMVIQAGAGRLGAPDGAARFAGIGEAGRQALAELERLVELLSTDDSRPRDLDTLLGQARAAGVRLDYTPLPDGVRVAPELQAGAYRVVQEGLTNARKHAGARRVEVVVRYESDGVELTVADDGRGDVPGDGSGHGLVGMRERIALYGGELEAGPRAAGGYELRVRLPLVAES